jgi:outer membrane protein
MMMRLTSAAAATAAALALTVPAHAEDMQGKVQVKLLGTAVLPSGKLKKVDTDLIGIPAGTDTEANDNYVPTLAVEYFFTNNVSVETICCMTQHNVDANAGPLAGAQLVADAKIIPATFTLKYHFGDHSSVTPYVGAGPTYFIVVDDKPGAGAVGLGATSFKLNDAFGVALQAGVDIPLGKHGFLLSLDAKKYFVSAKAHWYAGSTEVLATEHKLDPWLLSAGVGMSF